MTFSIDNPEGDSMNPPPLRKILCLGKTLRITRVKSQDNNVPNPPQSPWCQVPIHPHTIDVDASNCWMLKCQDPEVICFFVFVFVFDFFVLFFVFVCLFVCLRAEECQIVGKCFSIQNKVHFHSYIFQAAQFFFH